LKTENLVQSREGGVEYRSVICLGEKKKRKKKKKKRKGENRKREKRNEKEGRVNI